MKRILYIVMTSVLVLLSFADASAQLYRRENRKGNRAVAKGDYDKAMMHYDTALAKDTVNAIPLLYNAAYALHSDRRDSLQNMAKDTLAMQTADKVSDALKAGHSQGNTRVGETIGEPNAKLAGRSINGTLPKPFYGVQASGKVVVEIWVDNYGNVQKAVAGVEGTTVSDKNLWQAARKAALGAHFNMSAEAPALQKGTITYIFNLNQ